MALRLQKGQETTHSEELDSLLFKLPHQFKVARHILIPADHICGPSDQRCLQLSETG